jgi:hypothetical protein
MWADISKAKCRPYRQQPCEACTQNAIIVVCQRVGSLIIYLFKYNFIYWMDNIANSLTWKTYLESFASCQSQWVYFFHYTCFVLISLKHHTNQSINQQSAFLKNTRPPPSENRMNLELALSHKSWGFISFFCIHLFIFNFKLSNFRPLNIWIYIFEAICFGQVFTVWLILRHRKGYIRNHKCY